MAHFHPRLMKATTGAERMDALCEFIEFWLGSRKEEYGEPPSELNRRPLPMPLRQLYEFAGRWPYRKTTYEWVVPQVGHHDHLLTLAKLKYLEDGRIEFLYENQGVWNCRTMAEGDDPPVWCCGDQQDEEGAWFNGERLICDSLSHFLCTLVLQELGVGSESHLYDESLDTMFESQRIDAVPVWLNGQYAYGRQHKYNYFLWSDVLVTQCWESYSFCANDKTGLDFLATHQARLT